MEPIFLDYDARPRPKTNRFCVKCHRDIRPDKPARIVRVLEAMVLPANDVVAQDGEEFLIGLDCAKKLGLEYSRPETSKDHFWLMPNDVINHED